MPTLWACCEVSRDIFDAYIRGNLFVALGKYSSPVFAVKIGDTAIRKSIREQLGVLKSDAALLGEFPTVIGEIGTPMELDQKYSYGGADGKGKGKCDYREQVGLSKQNRRCYPQFTPLRSKRWMLLFKERMVLQLVR